MTCTKGQNKKNPVAIRLPVMLATGKRKNQPYKGDFYNE